MPELNRRFKLKIIPFTYVHIGSGESLDPTQYVVTNNKLWVLNQTAFINELAKTNPEAVAEFDKADFRGMAKLFSRYFNPEKKNTWLQAHDCSPEDQEDYLNKLEDTNSQMLIAAFTRNNLTGNPYIPGSSIKGSMRTAWLAYRVFQNTVSLERNRDNVIIDRDSEAKLLGYLLENKFGRLNTDITSDPFKYVKLADAEFSADYLALKTIRNIKENPGIPRKHKEEELAFQAQVVKREFITINAEISIDNRWAGGNNLGPQELFLRCKEYYKTKLRKDQSFYSYQGRPDMYKKLMDYVDGFGTNEFLLKLGKGSGSIFTSVNPQKPQTRTVIGGMPMGWCKVIYEEIT